MYTNNYVYFVTDSSFDYGDIGQTCYQEDLHGFSIKFTDDDIPILESIEGFGDFSDAKDHASSWDEFLNYLNENERHIDWNGPQVIINSPCNSGDEVFQELKNIVTEAIIKGL